MGKKSYFCSQQAEKQIMAAHNELGAWGEEQATAYLQHRGYDIIERDWKLGHKDLDIIAKQGNVVVFVEVKTRRNRVFIEPEEAIDYKKLQNLRQAINYYVKSKRINLAIRLDVITVVGIPEGCPPEISHIEDIAW